MFKSSTETELNSKLLDQQSAANSKIQELTKALDDSKFMSEDFKNKLDSAEDDAKQMRQRLASSKRAQLQKDEEIGLLSDQNANFELLHKNLSNEIKEYAENLTNGKTDLAAMSSKYEQQVEESGRLKKDCLDLAKQLKETTRQNSLLQEERTDLKAELEKFSTMVNQS